MKKSLDKWSEMKDLEVQSTEKACGGPLLSCTRKISRALFFH